MRQHHYLGALPKISETLWYVATWREEWVALLSFSASALKCAARDRWIGWNFRQRYSRLKLIVNNSRFLILPAGRIPNLGSRVLASLPKASGERLGSNVRSRGGVAGNLCRPAAFSRHRVSGGELGVRREHEGISAHSPGVHRDAPISQDGLRPTLAGRRPRVAVASRSSSPLSNRRFQNHAQRRADAIAPRVFPRDSRSPPRPRTAPWLVHRAGHRRRSRPVRHARLQGDRRLGRKVSDRKRASASAAVAKRAATSCPASRSSATC